FEYDAAAKQFDGGGGFFVIEPITGWDMAGNELFSWANVGGDHDVDKLDYANKEIVWQLSDGGDFTGDLPYPPWMHDLHVIDCPGYDECLLVYVNGVETDHT